MKNSKQNIFSLADLTKLGFKREDAGGFYYLIKYLDENNPVESRALVTPDFTDEDEKNVRFTVNLDKEPLDRPLTKQDIDYYINEYKQS